MGLKTPEDINEFYFRLEQTYPKMTQKSENTKNIPQKIRTC